MIFLSYFEAFQTELIMGTLPKRIRIREGVDCLILASDLKLVLIS